MLTAIEYLNIIPERFTKGNRPYSFLDQCRLLGLPATPIGYGIILCIDELGHEWTLAGEYQMVRWLISFEGTTGVPVTYLDGGRISIQRPAPPGLPLEHCRLLRKGWPNMWPRLPRDVGWNITKPRKQWKAIGEDACIHGMLS